MFRLLFYDRKPDAPPPGYMAPGGLPVAFESAAAVRLFRRPPDRWAGCTTVAALALPAAAHGMAELFDSEEPQVDGASSSSAPSACAAVNIVTLRRVGSDEAVPTTAALAVFQFTSPGAAVAFFRRNHGRRLTLPASKERE